MRTEEFLASVIDTILLKSYGYNKTAQGNSLIYINTDVHKQERIITLHKDQNLVLKNQVIKVIMPAIFCNSYKDFVNVYNNILKQTVSKATYIKYMVEI